MSSDRQNREQEGKNDQAVSRGWFGRLAERIGGLRGRGPAEPESASPALEKSSCGFSEREVDSLRVARTILDGKSVLLVEDNMDCVQIMRCLLGRWGLVVTTATSVEQAKRSLDEIETFDFAVLDFNLPDGTGDQVAQEFADRARRSSTILICLSAIQYYADPNLYDLVLSKPIRPGPFRDTLVELEKKRSLRAAPLES